MTDSGTVPVPPPTDRVTLVFTDVEKSTELWERTPDGMRDGLKRHDELLRRLLSQHGGYEVKTEGDAFMVAFACPVAALRWCIEVQRQLLDLKWDPSLLEQPEAALVRRTSGGPILFKGLRVRMGGHTGQPECRRDPNTGRSDYFGPVVNRAARVGAAGYGGQILLSEAWQSSLGTVESGPIPAELKDLGAHRFKGLSELERLFEATPEGLVGRCFPRLISHAGRQVHRVPDSGSFIGREKELAQLDDFFGKKKRLVTLIGPSGMGKTRLALEYGRLRMLRYGSPGGGVQFAELGQVRTAAELIAEIARSLGLSLDPGGSLDDHVGRVGKAIANRGYTLLILDDFTHVACHAQATVGRWPQIAPGLDVLVTSRTPLGLEHQTHLELAPLEASEAASLFNQRGKEANPAFEPDSKHQPGTELLAQELRGIPLGIELAAARLGMMTPAQIASSLEQLPGLSSKMQKNRPEPDSVLQATIRWTCGMLAAWEREILTQASVFRGSFTLDAAEAVLDASLHPEAPALSNILRSLKDRSLLQTFAGLTDGQQPRYRLHESIREFAFAGLETAQDRGDVERLHANHYLHVTASGPVSPAERMSAAHLGRLAQERANLLAIHEWGLVNDPLTAIKAALYLTPLLAVRGPAESLATLMDGAMACAMANKDPLVLIQVLWARAYGRFQGGRLQQALADYQEALALARASNLSLCISQGWLYLADIHLPLDQLREEENCLAHTLELCRSERNRALEGRVLLHLGKLKLRNYKWDEARAYFDGALMLFRAENAESGEARALENLGELTATGGHVSMARQIYHQAREIYLRHGDHSSLGNICRAIGELEIAARSLRAASGYLEESLVHARETGDELAEALAHAALGVVHAERGEWEKVRQHLETGLRFARNLHDSDLEGLLQALRILELACGGQVALAVALMMDIRRRQPFTGDPLPPLLDSVDEILNRAVNAALPAEKDACQLLRQAAAGPPTPRSTKLPVAPGVARIARTATTSIRRIEYSIIPSLNK